MKIFNEIKEKKLEYLKKGNPNRDLIVITDYDEELICSNISVYGCTICHSPEYKGEIIVRSKEKAPC
jgi:hypothetical protein